MNMNMNFYLPTRIFSGFHCVHENAGRIAALGSSVLLVTGKTAAKRSGALDDVLDVLDNAGISWGHYDAVAQNPTLESCFEAAAMARQLHADCIIGIGGGSALDAAKVIAVLAANPTMDQAQLYRLQWPIPPLPVICVGTTAGTGSEVTAVAVLTVPGGAKKSLHCDALYPTLSLGDPRYTASMPDTITRSTGVDALAHCIESYFCRKANELSMSWAIRGTQVLLPQLAQIVRDGVASLNLQNREALYNGSLYGGLAICITGTAFPHTMGYPLTEQHHVPHGTACAVFLPEFLEYNDTLVPALSAQFYAAIGMDKDPLIRLIEAATPVCGVTMSPEDIAALAPRWENNNTLRNTRGEMTQAVVAQLYQKRFGRKK